MKSKKISFLIAAHNEEKLIAKTLENLTNIPYANYEVIIGLDGCTDNTENIVKKYTQTNKNFKYFSLNLRKGKPAVINKIIEKSKGEIIIINDADWIFTVKDKKTLQEFISIFDDPKIGGIAESFPVEWDLKKSKKVNGGHLAVAYATKFWMDYLKQKYSTKEGNISKVANSQKFLTNIFLKKHYKSNTTLGDDFERTSDIVNSGSKVIFFNDIKFPRMIASYTTISFRDLFKQKVRTALARKQLNKKYSKKTFNNSDFIKGIYYILINSLKTGPKITILVVLWILITSSSALFSIIKVADTKSAWKLRARRQN